LNVELIELVSVFSADADSSSRGGGGRTRGRGANVVSRRGQFGDKRKGRPNIKYFCLKATTTTMKMMMLMVVVLMMMMMLTETLKFALPCLALP
jgi:hypothetical protein